MQKTNGIRIIGGIYKRSKLDVLDIEGLRPTPDRLRETLFNWLGDISNFSCLDMFAGSGVLGFECLSRGASNVIMLEKHKNISQQLEKTKQKLKIIDNLTIIQADSFLYIKNLIDKNLKFDLIFIDPPYNSNLIQLILPNVSNLIYNHSLIYVEYNQDISKLININKFFIYKKLKIGQIFAYLININI